MPRCGLACRQAEIDKAWQEAGERLAAAGRRDQQRVAASRRLIEQRQADAACGRQPRAANQPANGSGSPGLGPCSSLFFSATMGTPA